MATYTLLCGHTIPLKMAVHIAIADTEDCCPVCKVRLNPKEGFYLAYCDTTTMTLGEYIRRSEEADAKRRAERAANPPKPMLPTCSGICKSGKKCTKTATIDSGVYCNLHK
jgi:hypothetical protein